MPFNDIFKSELLKLCSRIGAEFNQGEAATQHLGAWAKPEKDRIEGGYCRGACLHWLQRILPASDKSDAIKADKIQVRGRSGSVISMATAYIKSGDIQDQNKLARSARVEQWKGELKGALTKLPGVKVSDDLSYEYPTSQTDSVKAALDGYDTQLAAHNEEIDKINQHGQLFVDWPDIGQHLASRFPDESYGNIRAFTGVANTSDSNAADFLCTVLAAADFQVNTGSLLHIPFEKKEGSAWIPAPAGHAIALFHETENTYVFFDPNLGCYKCAGTDNLLSALLLLVRYGYKDEKSRVAEQAFSGGYTLFKGPGATGISQVTREALAGKKNSLIAAIDKRIQDEESTRLREAQVALKLAGEAEKQFDDLNAQMTGLKKKADTAWQQVDAISKTDVKAYNAAVDAYKSVEKAHNEVVPHRNAADRERVKTFNVSEEKRVKAGLSSEQANLIRKQAYDGVFAMPSGVIPKLQTATPLAFTASTNSNAQPGPGITRPPLPSKLPAPKPTTSTTPIPPPSKAKTVSDLRSLFEKK